MEPARMASDFPCPEATIPTEAVIVIELVIFGLTTEMANLVFAVNAQLIGNEVMDSV